ncbi:MAG: DUF4157 domain-containing protein [Scytolyngbya sp. HA4215-MV1]|jgi:hypothetical protein|nr:DUF4157 domain-containing protein [Scytolyngbya sp. HA4215-MV1]
MTDSHSTSTPEATKASSISQLPSQDVQRANEPEVDQTAIEGQRAIAAMGGASPTTPPEQFSGALGQMSRRSQARMLRQLQRSYGNSYVGAVIQRKADGDGTCTDCEKKEKEIQRKGEGSVDSVPTGFEATMQRSGTGQPLNEGTRSFMESRFGQDFGDVKVHTDSAAAEAAKQIQAQAFTTRRDIYFGRERFRPLATEGKKLLAHELTHVVQQNGITTAESMAKPILGSSGDVFEREADRVANQIISDNSVGSDATGSVTTETRSLISPQNSTNSSINLIQRQDTNADVGGGATSATAPATIPGSSGPNSSFASPAIVAERKLIDVALESKDVGDVKRIRNFGLAYEEEKFKLIGILLDQTWVGPYDEYALEAIWGSFGDRLIKVASAHLELWNQCIERGAELENLPAVKQLSTWFIDDIKTLASNYLDTNKALVETEMTNAGIPFQEGEQPAPANQEQTQKLEKMQSAAKSIAHFQAQLELARQVYVGYSLGNIPPESKRYWLPVTFDPFRPPERFDAPEYDLNDPSPMKQPNPVYKVVPTQPYGVLLGEYKRGMQAVRELVTLYPMVYAISREGASAATKAFAETKDPALARNQLAGALRRLRTDINQTKAKLGKELDPLDLIPIHQQLFGGVKVGNIQGDWSLELSQQIARYLVGSHDLKNALAALALETVSQMAFMLSGFAQGPGMVALLAVGFGAAKIKADISAEQYQALLQASKTAVAPETDLVTPQQVDEAKAQNEADQAALALATINTAVGIAGALASWAGKKISIKDENDVSNAATNRAPKLGDVPEQYKGQPPANDVTPGAANDNAIHPNEPASNVIDLQTIRESQQAQVAAADVKKVSGDATVASTKRGGSPPKVQKGAGSTQRETVVRKGGRQRERIQQHDEDYTDPLTGEPVEPLQPNNPVPKYDPKTGNLEDPATGRTLTTFQTPKETLDRFSKSFEKHELPLRADMGGADKPKTSGLSESAVLHVPVYNAQGKYVGDLIKNVIGEHTFWTWTRGSH